MLQDVSLKQADSRILRSAFDDGLWDILLACFVLMFAVGPLLTDLGLGDFWSSVIFLPFWGLVYLGFRIVRKRFVLPRIGVVKLGQSQRLRLVRFNVVAFVVLTLGLLLGLASAGFIYDPIIPIAKGLFATFGVTSVRSIELEGFIHSIRFGLIVLMTFSVAAYFLGFHRLYAYGVLVFASPLVGEWLYRRAGVPHHGFPVTFGLTAALMLLVGLIIFGRLIRDTPARAEGMPTKEVRNG